jgi:pimeloyl-ACP methyl ester carboxylesterase
MKSTNHVESARTYLAAGFALAMAASGGLVSGGCTATPAEDPVETSDSALGSDLTAAGPSKVAIVGATGANGKAMRVFVPQSAAPAPGFGAVVFAHGFQLGVDDYDALLSHVASWGYVVLSVDYAQPLIGVDHRDARDALVSLGRALAEGRVDGLPRIARDRMAVAGHSLGGKAAVMAALAEPAFKAVLAFDPVDGAPGNPLGGEGGAKLPLLLPDAAGELAQPSLFVGAELSHCARPIFFIPGQACAPTGKDARAFYEASVSSSARYDVTLADFGHIDFLDRSVGGMTRDVCYHSQHNRGVRTKALDAISVAFLARHLEGKASAKTWLTGAKHDQLIESGTLVDPAATPRACP